MTHPSSSPAAPLVSVILPVFNGGPYLGEAIESILSQTFRDFELLVIDNCSTDESAAIARRYAACDARLTVLVNERNRSRAHSDNRGHALARGRYIAKMDADDVALPHRLQTQVNFLEHRPDVDLTSGFLQTFGATDLVYQYPVSPAEVRSALLFNMPVGNPTVFFRRRLLREHELPYDEQIQDTFGEDYEWIARVAQVAVIENQPEILLRYRTFPDAHKADVHARRTAKASLIRAQVLARAGFVVSARELHVHNTIAHYPFVLGDITLAEAHAWLLSLAAQNERLSYAEPAALRQVLAQRWFWICYHNADRQVDSYAQFGRHALGRAYPLSAPLQLKFWLKNRVLRHF
ncbi:glycosyltransferase family 2 protein [uncultured Hymenobacter sp.]|uniref:glycosyltransferase family 2 protein n=1 Tax=uncultured Hymenobacter sp. TaxID=170016 RepID=UPI0035CA6B10